MRSAERLGSRGRSGHTSSSRAPRSDVAGGARRGEGGAGDEAEVELLEEALAGSAPGDSALKARTLARLAVALHYGRTRERRAALSEAAIAMARRVGDPAALAYALNCRHWAL